MSTTIRSELSKKNEFWMEKHRYLELKHFCLQYPLWKRAYNGIDGIGNHALQLLILQKTGNIADPTYKYAEEKSYYKERIDMIEEAARTTDPQLHTYILKGVTEGVSYENLRLKHNMPCSRELYYKLYRRFFWFLSRSRD